MSARRWRRSAGNGVPTERLSLELLAWLLSRLIIYEPVQIRRAWEREHTLTVVYANLAVEHTQNMIIVSPVVLKLHNFFQCT